MTSYMIRAYMTTSFDDDFKEKKKKKIFFKLPMQFPSIYVNSLATFVNHICYMTYARVLHICMNYVETPMFANSQFFDQVHQPSSKPLYVRLSKSGSYIGLWEVGGIVNRRIESWIVRSDHGSEDPTLFEKKIKKYTFIC